MKKQLLITALALCPGFVLGAITDDVNNIYNEVRTKVTPLINELQRDIQNPAALQSSIEDYFRKNPNQALVPTEVIVFLRDHADMIQNNLKQALDQIPTSGDVFNKLQSSSADIAKAVVALKSQLKSALAGVNFQDLLNKLSQIKVQDGSKFAQDVKKVLDQGKLDKAALDNLVSKVQALEGKLGTLQTAAKNIPASFFTDVKDLVNKVPQLVTAFQNKDNKTVGKITLKLPDILGDLVDQVPTVMPFINGMKDVAVALAEFLQSTFESLKDPIMNQLPSNIRNDVNNAVNMLQQNKGKIQDIINSVQGGLNKVIGS